MIPLETPTFASITLNNICVKVGGVNNTKLFEIYAIPLLYIKCMLTFMTFLKRIVPLLKKSDTNLKTLLLLHY